LSAGGVYTSAIRRCLPRWLLLSLRLPLYKYQAHRLLRKLKQYQILVEMQLVMTDKW